MRITITNTYLWLPVDMSAEEIKLNIYEKGQQIQEISIRLGTKHCDFYGAWKVAGYCGRELELTASGGEEILKKSPIRQEDARPVNEYSYRPKLHYAPEFGWVNDPNGLVYQDGIYHLFHQYNPYSTEWENMSWGHAVSRDLLHWEEQDVALCPDQYGTMYSGCGFVDKENCAGYGKDALLFFYTAAGGRNEWSVREGNAFTQRLCWSTDQAKTIYMEETEILPWIKAENRDPKVFRHEPSNAYIMVLYLDENEFLILRSKDLFHWGETQRLSIPGMWECPLLMELSVEESTEKKWVFWSADGYYVTGQFDGYQFTAESERSMAYFSRRAYAAQTYENTADRVILVPWLRLDNAWGNYHGMMGLPQTLTLRRTKDGLRIAFRMVEELNRLRGEWETLPVDQKVPVGGEARELSLRWRPGTTGSAELAIGETVLRIDFAHGTLKVDTSRLHNLEQEETACFDPADGLDLTVVVDQEVLEVLGDHGMICGAIETEENVLGAEVLLRSKEAPEKACWCILK